jgi:phage head maturation protease
MDDELLTAGFSPATTSAGTVTTGMTLSSAGAFDFDATIERPDWAPVRGERARRDFPIEVRRTRASGSDVDNRTTVTINTLDEDRHGTIIEPKGARLDEYGRNPVVLINHDYSLLAATSSVSRSETALVANLSDEDWDHDDPEVERWFRKLKRGLLKAASIGFMVHDYVEEMIDPEGDPRDWRNLRYRITDWELVEWSLVSVPSNPAALVTQRMMDRMGHEQGFLQPLRGRTTAGSLSAGPRDPAPTSAEDADEGSRGGSPDPSPGPAESVPPVVSAPRRRQAGPADYAALALAVTPVIRSELLRITGKA